MSLMLSLALATMNSRAHLMQIEIQQLQEQMRELLLVKVISWFLLQDLVKLVIMKLQVQATILMMISMDGSREHII
jgi:hypothetical protein